MNFFLQPRFQDQARLSRQLSRLFVITALSLFVIDRPALAGVNLTRTTSSFSGAHGTTTNPQSSTSQTSTAATVATTQATQTAAMTQLAQVSMQRSVEVLHALQAQQAAQSAARNLALTGPNNLGTLTQPLLNVPDGIAVNGLVPGVIGVDPANPASPTVATTITPTANSSGTTSVTLAANSAITLPPSATGNSQITVSGTGTVGTITTGNTITPLTAGVATTVTPGSTISLTTAGTITFTGGSAAAPATFSTYNFVTTPATSTAPAVTSNVPASWTGIGGLTQSTYAPATGQAATPYTVTVTQTQQQALLTWQTFNIGKNTTLDFDQSQGGANVANWVAINTVADNIAPSQILGSIQAPGQVYVVNQNGIIFGGSSQVNAGALVASSLPINTNLISRGLLNNPDLQFLFSQLNLSAGSQGPTPAFTPQGTSAATATSPAPGSYGKSGGLISQVDTSGDLSLVQPTGQDGDVVVQAGAQLNSPTTPEHVGGRIALVGPNVNNSGTISTPDGQTILAAGLQVGFVAHPSNDPSLRGLDVSVGEVSDPSYDGGATGVSGTVTNDGQIEIPRADLMMVGQTVNQNGVVDSSTSVTLNGRIDLLGDYDSEPAINGENGFQGTSNYYPTASGQVSLGANSLTEILPDGEITYGANGTVTYTPPSELPSTDTVVGTQLALSSLVNIQSGSVYLGTDSLLFAPSAALPSNSAQPALGDAGADLTAGVSLSAGDWIQLSGATSFTYDDGQVYLDSGATIDVSGSENVAASVSEDVIPVQLRGTELANSPLQQNGPLRGATVYVNILDTGNYDGTEWVGTPIGDVSGYVNLVQRTVGELTTAGGTVAINAGDSTVMQAGSSVNVSGGWINYQGADVQTTQVVSDGLVYNISQATPDLVYSGIYTGFNVSSAKWGVTQTYANSLQSGTQYDPGYIQGGNGGGISISTPALALDGTLLGDTVAGSYQRTPASQVATTFGGTSVLPTMLNTLAMPDSSALTIAFQVQDTSQTYFSPTPPDVVFASTSTLPAVGAFGTALPAQRIAEVDLSPSLFDSDGFGSLNLTNGDGDITVSADISLPFGGSAQPNGGEVAGGAFTFSQTNGTSVLNEKLIAGGSITFVGANIDIEANVTAPGAALSFTADNFSPYDSTQILPSANPGRGDFTLGADASLNTAGLVVDDQPTSPGAGTAPMLTGGGSVTIKGYNVDIDSGTQARDAIDVSGGVDISAAGKFTYGNGGSINIASGQDPIISAILGGQLVWNPNLAMVNGYSGSKGGSLTVKAPLIQIGGSTLLNGDSIATGNTLWLDQTDADGNLLQPEFFSQGGFTSFTLGGIGEIAPGGIAGQYLPSIFIAPNTTIDPVAENSIASLDGAAVYLTDELLPQGVRTPVSLTFNTPYAKDPYLGTLLIRGAFIMGAGSVIQTDPQTNPNGGVFINSSLSDGSIVFSNSAGVVEILGQIIAPGGTIAIGAGGASNYLYGITGAAPTLDLGPDSLLSTAGVVNLVPNAQGYQEGSVLNGGTISIDGNIIAEAGSVLDVSGTSGVLDESPNEVNLSSTTFLSAPIPTEVDSNGGSINLQGEQELFTDATLLGQAGGPTATGGSLSVSSGIFLNNQVQSVIDPTLNVVQSGLTIPVPLYYPQGQTPLGNAVVDGQGNVLAAQGYFVADRFESGGFSSLTLGETVQFSGPVTITADQSLIVGQAGVIYADSTVNLNAPYVDLGAAFESPLPTGQQLGAFVGLAGPDYFSPTYGTGTLNVNASLIDVGDLSLQNIGSLNLTAADGDIRGDGTLDVSGAITLTAGQIYPTTDNSFTIVAYDYNGTVGNGSVTIAADGTRELPLSAGGQLDVYASNITQGGVLRAPLGTINLGSGVTGAAPIDYITGSGVPGVTPSDAISSTENLTLSAGSITSVSAVDPTTGLALDLPYGTNTNGVTWNDPSGNNITQSGNGVNAIPAKTINLSGVNVTDQPGNGIQAGAIIDISGGGDLFSYSFVTGTGGTNDILGSSSSFAVIPGYQAAYAPYYSTGDYTNSNLAVGEQIYLNASGGLPAGVYTLLPARYALEPGAFLVTPLTTPTPAGSAAEANGTSIVSGYEFNGLNTARTGQPLLTSFQVDSPAAVAARATYDVLSANTFLSQAASAAGLAEPRLPNDAGQLVLAAAQNLVVGGSVNSQPQDGGLGGLVDIATTSNILITGPNTDVSADESGLSGSTLVLDSSDLSAFGADSLLIGGYRQSTTSGNSVVVTTGNLTVDNEGASVTVNNQTLTGLSAPDVILVSNGVLQVDQGSVVQASSNPVSAQSLGIVNGESNEVTVASSGTNSPVVTLTSATLPFDFAVGSQLLGSTVLSIQGNVVTLAADADASVQSNTNESFSSAGGSNLVVVASSSVGDPEVTLASPTLPAGFGVGSQLLGSVVQSISGTTVMLASSANAFATNAVEPFAGAGGANLVSIASSSSGSPTVTLASATLPPGLAIGSQLLGSTVLSISGPAVTLAGGANASISATTSAEFSTSGNLVPIASSAAGSSTVTLASTALPAGFGVGSGLLGSTVASIDGTTVTLAGNANATISNQSVVSDADGAVLRVSSDPAATISRPDGVNTADTNPQLLIGAGAGMTGATIGGESLILDSTGAGYLNSTTILNSSDTVSIDSGQINLVLDNSQPQTGLVLSSSVLAALQSSVQALSFLSYSSLDIYGSGAIGDPETGGQFPLASLVIHAAEIRGFSQTGGGGDITINAGNFALDNSPNGVVPGATESASGSLTVNAATIYLGTNQTNIDQYSDVTLNASDSILLDPETKVTELDTSVFNGTGGVTASNNLTLSTPLITAGSFSSTQAPASETISAADGNLVLDAGETAEPSVTEALGAKLTLSGQTITENTLIELPSGTVALEATDGDLTVVGTVSVAGTAKTFSDVTEYTSAGQVTLTSDAGSVVLADTGIIDVSANSGSGNAGSLTVNASTGTFIFNSGTVDGQAGTDGSGGTFSADLATLDPSSTLSNGLTNTNTGNNLTPLETLLNTGGFTQSQSIRLRGGMVDGVTYNDVYVSGNTTATQVNAGAFNLSADTGSIVVTGTINASDVAATDSNGNPILVGGTIDLTASGSLTLASGSILTVAAQNFDNAGKGGSVSLTAGAETNGNFVNTALNTSSATGPLLDIETGSTIDLSVAANNGTADGGNSASLGHLTGTLVISAPQTVGNTDLQVAPINGNILNASSIIVEGNQVFNATADGSIDNQEANVMSNGTLFAGNTTAILNRLYQSNANGTALGNLTSVEPGAEIINTTGNLTLASDWDLSTYRFGPNVTSVDGSGVPGILTLRAAGNVVFDFGASLSDGFDTANTSFASSSYPLWTAPLLPAGDQSWSYQIVAGADFSAADFNQVSTSPVNGGSILVGKGAPALPTDIFGNDRSYVLAGESDGSYNYFQTIRTGTGNITLDAGGDVQLLNNLATIYTAGTQASPLTGFTTPTDSTNPQSPYYGPQYSLDGGNIFISAVGDIAHDNSFGAPDSSLELPTTWLYRQGAVSGGQFVDTTSGHKIKQESTSWWVDFSNFLEGVGALGGGNVTLIAGGSVDNVDAVIPTNERTTLQITLANGTVDSVAADQKELELGGGDLLVQAGANIDGGVYYVERGQGTLAAGNQILTNSTRAAVALGDDSGQSADWLPTTLFLGQGSFNVTAGGDLLLGPVANPFLLPQGANNSSADKSYFSTYAATDSVNVSSLSGTVTLKDDADEDEGSLADWYTNIYLAPNGQSYGTSSQPWLSSSETSFSPFFTVATLLPSTLNATAFSGDIDVLGSLTLTPSTTGTIDLLAAGSLNGFQVNFSNPLTDELYWGSSTINLSDANPAGIPDILSPLSSSLPNTDSAVLSGVNNLFAETGDTQDLALQTEEALHADIDGNVLHANDPNPIHLIAGTGDISGFTLYSAKAAQIIAGQDITDIALYIQNANASAVSVVAAGRDIVAYDPQSALRLQAQAPGNTYIGESITDLGGVGSGGPEPGDIQIAGPGTIEVLAGRNFDLGTGSNNGTGSEDPGGTEAGLTSVGNEQNPYLPFGGAQIVAAAGLGESAGLDNSQLNFGDVSLVNGAVSPDDPANFATTFIDQFLSPTSANAGVYLPDLGTLMSLPSTDSDAQIWNAFAQLSSKQQDVFALDIFYLALRDAGRNQNTGIGQGYGLGYAAINALFPGSTTSTGAGGALVDNWSDRGSINVGTREIETSNGGDIDLLVPNGSLTVGTLLNNQPLDQGLLTEDGGNISIFTENNVNVGSSRIFTLHGGNEIIWSTFGNIAAGNSSKTVQSAPPTRVLIDPQSGGIETDLAGLATGGGIGVLETVVGAPPADVDLIAPSGTVDAGDAGIRVSGNLNIAAAQVLNAGNIQVGGKSAGVPTASAPNIAGLTAASSASGSATSASNDTSNQQRNQLAQQGQQDIPSIITVEVLGYGGNDDD